MFVIFLISFVGVLTAMGLPLYVNNLTGKTQKLKWLLYCATFIYAVSWLVPSPLIHGRDTSFMTHVLGGGVYSGLVWLYILHNSNSKLRWDLQLVTLLGLVSLLGAANEMLELLLVEVWSIRINSFDVWWDILANSIGALALFVGYRILLFCNNRYIGRR